MFCQSFQGSQVFHLQVMRGHAAVTNGLVVKFLEEILEDIIYPHPGEKVPLSDGLIQCFWNISLVADVLGEFWQLHLLYHGIMGDGQDSHPQTLVLYVMPILLSLGVSNWSQAFDQVILSLSKQIFQGAGIKERSCIWNFFFLIAIFLLLRRMSPY